MGAAKDNRVPPPNNDKSSSMPGSSLVSVVHTTENFAINKQELNEAPLPFDATKLFEALKYQIHVAIEHCHSLKDDESLWIEVFGDVTVGNDSQIEVKLYEDDLTDSHENLWNTLNNWLKPAFNHAQYGNLILLTTQTYGARSTIKDWNQLSPDKRLKALEEILNSAEARYAKQKAASAPEKEPKPPKALKLQRSVLADKNRQSLQEALRKIQIITDQPNLLEHIERYVRFYLRHILPGRENNYLDDLFGFITTASKLSSGWKITGAEFTAKIRELSARYSVGTVKFPTVDHNALQHQASVIDVNERLFVKKLYEIGGQEFVPEATADLLHAEHYISELIKDCAISPPDIESYCRNHHQIHCRSRLAEIEDIDVTLDNEGRRKKSRKFYLSQCAKDVAQFCSFEHTPTEFRNGIYQMLADEPTGTRTSEFHWRLWE